MDKSEGIKAIIFLQSVAGAEESEEAARKGWSRLSEAEQCHTMRVYGMMKKRTESSKGESDA